MEDESLCSAEETIVFEPDAKRNGVVKRLGSQIRTHLLGKDCKHKGNQQPGGLVKSRLRSEKCGCELKCEKTWTMKLLDQEKPQNNGVHGIDIAQESTQEQECARRQKDMIETKQSTACSL